MSQHDCYGCGVAPGQPHDEGCDWAKCPSCGQQLILSDCCPRRDEQPPAMWHGLDPEEEVALAQGWFTVPAGATEPFPDYTRVRVAEAFGQVTWNPESQRFDIGEIDNARLDQALR